MINKYLELAIVLLSCILALALPGQGVLFGFAAVLIYSLIGNRKQKFRNLGFFHPGSIGKLFSLTLLFGAILELSFQSFIEPIIEMLLGSNLDLSNFDAAKGNFTNYLILLAIGWIVGGFLEEILFRGFIFRNIADLFPDNKIIGNTIGVLITSSVFGFSHLYQGWAGVISTGLISVILCLVYIHFNRNLWYSILIHGFNNTVGITIIYLDISDLIETSIFG